VTLQLASRSLRIRTSGSPIKGRPDGRRARLQRSCR
jgi:hypothetical protein